MAEQKDTQSLFRQESLERLSSPERLDELMTIVNLKTWLPLGTIGVLLFAALLWSIVGRIPVTTVGRGTLVHKGDASSELVALLEFDNSYRGQFRPGMEVVLMPETLLVYNEPGVKAEIAEVLEPPALTLDQVRQSQVSMEAAPQGQLEVFAHLAEMGAMPDNTIVSGVEVEGRVTIEERAPIAFIFPFLAP